MPNYLQHLNTVGTAATIALLNQNLFILRERIQGDTEAQTALLELINRQPDEFDPQLACETSMQCAFSVLHDQNQAEVTQLEAALAAIYSTDWIDAPPDFCTLQQVQAAYGTKGLSRLITRVEFENAGDY